MLSFRLVPMSHKVAGSRQLLVRGWAGGARASHITHPWSPHSWDSDCRSGSWDCRSGVGFWPFIALVTSRVAVRDLDVLALPNWWFFNACLCRHVPKPTDIKIICTVFLVEVSAKVKTDSPALVNRFRIPLRPKHHCIIFFVPTIEVYHEI